MARFTRFADILDLGDDALRALVTGGGDEPERVWAAWAMGLRHHSDASALLRASTFHEPSAGVRAQLAIVLVAHGERAAAVALARRDPSPIVPASAWRCLARTAASDDRELNELLGHALASERAAEVRLAIVDGIRADAPTALRDRALALLAESDPELRGVVIDFALRSHVPAGGFPSFLRQHALREPDPATFARLVDLWIADAGAPSLLHALESQPEDVIARALAHVAARDTTLLVAELEPLLALSHPAVDAQLATLVARGRIEAPLRWLLLFVVRYLRACRSTGLSRDTRALRWDAASVARERLEGAIAASLDAAVVSTDRELATELVTAIEKDALQASSAIGTDVDALVRYVRQEPLEQAVHARVEAAAWRYDDFEELNVYGLELLPALRRLARG